MKLYRLTDVAVEVPLVEGTAEIFMDNGPEEGVVVEYQEIDPLVFNVCWNIGKRQQSVGSDIYLRAGNRLVASFIITPNDKSVRAGIVFPNGDREYRTGTDTVVYSKEIEKSGLYRIFVENLNDTEVTVDWTYVVR